MRAEYRKQHSVWQIWENAEGGNKGMEGFSCRRTVRKKNDRQQGTATGTSKGLRLGRWTQQLKRTSSVSYTHEGKSTV